MNNSKVEQVPVLILYQVQDNTRYLYPYSNTVEELRKKKQEEEEEEEEEEGRGNNRTSCCSKQFTLMG
jgi:hypothetical protein